MKEYEEKMGKMGKRIEDQNFEIKELKEKVTTLMGKNHTYSFVSNKSTKIIT